MMEAGPTDPEKASQLELPDKHKFFTSFNAEPLLVQTPKAGIRVDISRDTVGKRTLVEKGTKLEVYLTPVPNLQLADPDLWPDPHTDRPGLMARSTHRSVIILSRHNGEYISLIMTVK